MVPKVKITDWVLYGAVENIKPGHTARVYWPALVYKIVDKDRGTVGLYIFTDTGMRKLAHVYYHEDRDECYKLKED